MGIKHLDRIQKYLEQNKKFWFTETNIRNELSINRFTVVEVLNYLLKEKKIVLKDKKYKFRG